MTSPVSVALPIRRALLSVSDKTGIVELARALAAADIELLSTGGTARLLQEAGIAVCEVSDHTGFPEIMDGRVKTLHPRIHAGLLARRDTPAHLATLDAHDIPPIDLLVVNLYPFGETVARPDCTFEDAIENIDIGGPAMLRAAAKNHAGVAVVVDPADYRLVIDAVEGRAALDAHTRLGLATKVFAHTARYDGAVAAWLSSVRPDGARDPFPAVLTVQLERAQALRYGENPHQLAAFYRDPAAAPGTFSAARQLQGKELSFNNIADADAAWQAVHAFDTPACVIVKHANPCGVAIADTPLLAYQRAFETDPTSAFGGIVAFNRPVDASTAQAVTRPFVEVVIAPAFDADALDVFATKPNVRLLALPAAESAPTPSTDAVLKPGAFDWRRVGGGLLVQSMDHEPGGEASLHCVTRVVPDAQQRIDLQFAWRVARFVKSNAIVFCRDGRTLGIGAGQMSRVDSARIAGIKAANAGLSLKGSVVASDAFFPFRDGLDVVVAEGATAVVQPGGSVRDPEVIAAADEHGITMVVTGVRHFRH